MATVMSRQEVFVYPLGERVNVGESTLGGDFEKRTGRPPPGYSKLKKNYHQPSLTINECLGFSPPLVPIVPWHFG